MREQENQDDLLVLRCWNSAWEDKEAFDTLQANTLKYVEPIVKKRGFIIERLGLYWTDILEDIVYKVFTSLWKRRYEPKGMYDHWARRIASNHMNDISTEANSEQTVVVTVDEIPVSRFVPLPENVLFDDLSARERVTNRLVLMAFARSSSTPENELLAKEEEDEPMNEIEKRLKECLSTLSDTEQNAVILYWCGWNDKDISEKIGRAHKSIKARRSAGLKKLRSCMGDLLNED